MKRGQADADALGDVGALRAALAAAFEAVFLRPSPVPRTAQEALRRSREEFYVEPHIRRELVEENIRRKLGEDPAPDWPRVPLYLAENNLSGSGVPE